MPLYHSQKFYRSFVFGGIELIILRNKPNKKKQQKIQHSLRQKYEREKQNTFIVEIKMSLPLKLLRKI